MFTKIDHVRDYKETHFFKSENLKATFFCYNPLKLDINNKKVSPSFPNFNCLEIRKRRCTYITLGSKEEIKRKITNCQECNEKMLCAEMCMILRLKEKGTKYS